MDSSTTQNEPLITIEDMLQALDGLVYSFEGNIYVGIHDDLNVSDYVEDAVTLINERIKERISNYKE